MIRTERDEERDERIEMEIIVDTYSLEEQVMGWHAYLDDTLDSLLEARCRTEREESPLKQGETVRVVGMPSTDPTLRQQFVTIERKKGSLVCHSSNLSRLTPAATPNKPSRTGTIGSNADSCGSIPDGLTL